LARDGCMHDSDDSELMTIMVLIMELMIILMMASIGRVRGHAPRPMRNSFMAAEPWYPLAAPAPRDQRSLHYVLMGSDIWLADYLQEKMRIETIGRRRGRSGKDRCAEALEKYLEYRRSGGAPGSRWARSRVCQVE